MCTCSASEFMRSLLQSAGSTNLCPRSAAQDDFGVGDVGANPEIGQDVYEAIRIRRTEAAADLHRGQIRIVDDDPSFVVAVELCDDLGKRARFELQGTVMPRERAIRQSRRDRCAIYVGGRNQ